GLTRHGSIKLLDAGTAPFIPAAELRVAATFAPPEVLDGAPSSRSDAYALSLVYYKLRTGRMPFVETLDLARQKQLKKRGRGAGRGGGRGQGDEPEAGRAVRLGPGVRRRLGRRTRARGGAGVPGRRRLHHAPGVRAGARVGPLAAVRPDPGLATGDAQAERDL